MFGSSKKETIDSLEGEWDWEMGKVDFLELLHLKKASLLGAVSDVATHSSVCCK